jgi:two-component system, sensor histidine kinase LadS
LMLLAGTVASSSGIGALYFWREYPELSNASLFFLPLAVSAAALSFVRIVLSPRQFAPWLDRSLLALATLLLMVGTYDVIWPSLNGFAITNALVLSSALAFVLTALMAARQRNPNVRWLGLGFAPMVVVALLVLRNFDLLQLDIGTASALMLASVWAVPVLFFGLNRRLALRRESEVRARAVMQSDALTGLARDRVLTVRLQGALLRARRTQQSFGLLVVEVSNLAALRREFGRGAAEQALVLAATRLQGLVRDVDTAARLGEQEFAVLIEAPCSAADLTQIATRLLAQSLRPSELLPPGATLKLHISMAIAPHGDLNETELLGYLLADVSRISPEHGKAISTCAF